MRNIRTKRVRTQGINYFAHPFQDSILELELDKLQKCLLQVRKNQFQKASDIVKQLSANEATASLSYKDRNMLKSFLICLKSYLYCGQRKYDEALFSLKELKEIKIMHENLHKMKTVLSELVRSIILCELSKVEEAKLTVQMSLEVIKSIKNGEGDVTNSKIMQNYSFIFIIFMDIIVLQLSKLFKGKDILGLYREGYHLSENILGKSHKLARLMKRVLMQSIKQKTFDLKTEKNSTKKLSPIKIFQSKRKLKVNEQKMVVLSSKEQEMRRIYDQNDQAVLGKLTISNKLTRKENNHFLRSLEKVKSIYNSRKLQMYNTNEAPNSRFNMEDSFTKNEDSDRGFSRKRIKDIILKGRRLNTDILCDTDFTGTEFNGQLGSQLNENGLSQNLPVNETYKLQQQSLQKPKTSGLIETARKIEIKQQKKDQCQLI